MAHLSFQVPKESGLYYLQSRYYDPEIGRFINSDKYFSTGYGVLGSNAFAYCNNNPIQFIDPCGTCIHYWYLFGLVDCEDCKDLKARSVQYNIPLYSQGMLPLCWAYCQTMVESYQNGKTLTQEEADKRAKEIAIGVYGESNWKRGGWPTNRGKAVDGVSTIEDLNSILSENGPVYAYYSDGKKAHLVVVTGVDLYRGYVYTNNPSGIKGKQTFSAFMDGYTTRWYDGRIKIDMKHIYPVVSEDLP